MTWLLEKGTKWLLSERLFILAADLHCARHQTCLPPAQTSSHRLPNCRTVFDMLEGGMAVG